jgi:glutathione-specific gamma-glutamylcyclotransferase
MPLRAAPDELWIFGYGSLIFRPDFPYVARSVGFITGWTRRFWQASLDHRGTPERPGRVATLVESTDARCWGVAYRVDDAHRAQVLDYLDVRECGGYSRASLPFFDRDAQPLPDVLVYIADRANPNYRGPEATHDIAACVRAACGLSGPNREYVLQLAAALDTIGADDPHVFELAAALEHSC